MGWGWNLESRCKKNEMKRKREKGQNILAAKDLCVREEIKKKFIWGLAIDNHTTKITT